VKPPDGASVLLAVGTTTCTPSFLPVSTVMLHSDISAELECVESDISHRDPQADRLARQTADIAFTFPGYGFGG